MQTKLPIPFNDFGCVLNYTLVRERRLYLSGPRLLSLEICLPEEMEIEQETHFRLEHFAKLFPLPNEVHTDPLRMLTIRITKVAEDEVCRYFKVKTGGAGGWFYEVMEFKGFDFISEFRRGEWVGE